LQAIYTIMPAVVCPLCGERKARRACPAVSHQICAVCCGTKRLTEIRCPSECTYLASAREHPPAAFLRQRQRDMGVLLHGLRDLDDRQSQLFFSLTQELVQYEVPELQRLLDDDVAEAAGAMAATFETAARGVIYDHQPASLPAQRLATALAGRLADSRRTAGSAFDRDAAVVLRRIEETARALRTAEPSNARSFLDLLGRALRDPALAGTAPEAQPRSESLILP
jgi:hypothetical protein